MPSDWAAAWVINGIKDVTSDATQMNCLYANRRSMHCGLPITNRFLTRADLIAYDL